MTKMKITYTYILDCENKKNFDIAFVHIKELSKKSCIEACRKYFNNWSRSGVAIVHGFYCFDFNECRNIKVKRFKIRKIKK